MEKEIIRLNVSDARGKLTQLDKLLKPGEALEITSVSLLWMTTIYGVTR